MDILKLIKSKNKGQSLEDLQEALDLEDQVLLLEELGKLERKGLIRKSKRGLYLASKREAFYKGTMSIPGKSYGFFVFEDGSREDIFVHSSNFKGAMDGDTVLVRLLPFARGQRQEGRVERILERRHKKVLGIYHSQGYVLPLSRRLPQPIFVDKKDKAGARSSEIVQVRITNYGSRYSGLKGKIVQRLGLENSPGLDFKLVVEEFGLEEDFPLEVLEEARAFKSPSYKEEESRPRIEELVFTIDGADAKDFDDAISISRLEDGYRLGVHIADVSHYVKEGGALDREALKRGTSTYLVDRVIPMLPLELSTGLCSLAPGQDKLCISVLMDINSRGKVDQVEIFPSILKSSYRLVYEDVSNFIAGQEDEKLEPLREELFLFKELTDILLEARKKRGAIDFGSSESLIIVDNEGWPLDIRPREQGLADQMIEEAMVLTNTVISQHFSWMELPFLYRSHEKPDREKMVELNKLLHSFGYLLKGDLEDIHPKELSSLLESLKGKPEKRLLEKKILRYLKQARYTDVLVGHFGLALKHYSHFTAPIRRYPDLQIHRIVKEALLGMSDERRRHYGEILADVAEKSSINERRAEEAERRMGDIKKAEFMQDKIGWHYTARVSGFTSFGLFLALDNSIEGMIRFSDMQEYYQTDENQTKLISSRGREIHIGQAIEVVVKAVDVYRGEINFSPGEYL